MTPSPLHSIDPPKGRRCLITGATGFIGGALGRALCREGWIVTALARETSDRSGLHGYPVRWVSGDLGDPGSLAPALDGQEIIFHCAGLTKALSEIELQRVNRIGSRNLFAACAEMTAPPARIIMLSSQAAAGPALPDGTPLRESDPAQPVSAYGRSKREGELEGQLFKDRLNITILRPVAVYGPRERDFHSIFKSIARTGLHAEVGFRSIKFQAICSGDLVEAIILAARAEAKWMHGRSFFVGHPRAWASDDFAREIARALGRKRLPILRIPWPAARIAAAFADAAAHLRGKPLVFSRDKLDEMAAAPWLCSMDAFAIATGFRAKTDAPEGLELTAKWYKDHGWL